MILINSFVFNTLTILIFATRLWTTLSQSEDIYQRYTVYSQVNCEGKSETFISSERHLNHVNTSRLGYFGQVKSRRIHSGVWREFSHADFVDDFPSEPSIIDANAGSVCITGSLPDSTFRQHKSIRMAGNQILTSMGLSLFSQTYFAGEELYFEGTRLSLPTQQTFESWGYTGKGDWTFYEAPEFRGRSTCLRPKTTTLSLVTFETKTFLLIGSLHRGCYASLSRIYRNEPVLNVIDMSDSEKLPGLTLYTFQSHLLNIGREVRLPRSGIFGSYSFSGSKPTNWTIYERTVDAEEKRFPRCVFHDGHNKTRPEDLIFYFKIPLQIVGVQKGCAEDPKPDLRYQQLQNSATPPMNRICAFQLIMAMAVALTIGIVQIRIGDF